MIICIVFHLYLRSFFQLILVIFSMFAIILFRITLLNMIYYETYNEGGEQSVWFSQARLLTSLTASSLNLIVIIVLNKLYEYVALWLVNFEQPRTQTDFEQSYTFKMFCFQFINFYLPLIYIACFKVQSVTKEVLK